MRTIATGLVYRNPRPEVRSVNAWHPSLLRLSDGRLLCSFDLGQAPESHDYNTYLSWSADDAATWSEPHPLRPPTTSGRPSTYSVRIGRLRDGTLTAFGASIVTATTPLLASSTILPSVSRRWSWSFSRSVDGGHVWSPMETIVAPLEGPAFRRSAHQVVELRDGHWLAHPHRLGPDRTATLRRA